MNQPQSPDISLADEPMSRRGILRAGGMTIAFGALMAACVADVTDKKPGRVGEAPSPTALPEAVVNDGVLFRTATSMHYSFIDAFGIATKLGQLKPDQAALVEAFTAAHRDAIKSMQEQSKAAGAKPWTCANPRFDRVVLGPIRDRFTGRAKIGNEEVDVAKSDNPNRDAMALIYAIENLATAMHQSLVPQFSKPEYRADSMFLGQAAARRSAVVAISINPENLVNKAALRNANLDLATTTTAAATTTTQNIAKAAGVTATTVAAVTDPQQYYAIPSQFGTLSAVQLAVGAPSSGTQFTINIETPSLNSFIYDYQSDADCVGLK